MPRYVLVNRRAGKFTAEQKHASRAAVAMTLASFQGSLRIVSDKDPADELARRVVVLDADASRVANMQASLPPDAVLEPLIRRSLHFRRPVEWRHALSLTAASAQVTASSVYRVTITGAGKPLSGIQVIFYLQDPTGQMRTAQVSTDQQGQAMVNAPGGYTLSFVEPIPYSDFWIMLSDAPPSGSTVDCAPIAKAGLGGGGWWHTAMGIDVNVNNRGAGLKVGVIDTGCGPHPNLAHVNLVGVFVDGQVLPPAQATDVAEHGTHTTGIIGARPTQDGDYAGLAAGCDLYHARVFKSEDEGPSQADLINAIDSLSRDNGCDLINMSLGGGAFITSGRRCHP